MLTFVLRRFLEALLVLFLIVTATFFLVRLVPGGPFDREKDIPEVTRQQLEAYYGLDKPLPVQYVNYLGRLVRGDLGTTFKYPGWTVNEIIARKLPVSVELGALAMGIALVLGIGAGVLAAWRPGSATDTFPMSMAMLGICLPTFVLGPLLILVFGLKLNLVNVMGWNLPQDRIRLHACWGNYEGPHDADVPIAEMLPILTQAHAGSLLLPMGNPRHQHEYRAFTPKNIPDDMSVIVGCIDTTTNYVEHPETVADRLERVAQTLGDPTRILAATDCGFDTSAGAGRVVPSVVWSKLGAMVEGAKIASGRLF